MSQRTVKAILLDGMGTLIRLVPPAPALAAALDVDERTADRAFRAEVAYYVAHHLEGGDPDGLSGLRDRCAQVVADITGRDRASAREALLGSLRFEAFEDAPPALSDLRERGLRLIVVSNWDCSLPQVLEDAGLSGLVDGVIASAVIGAAKPDRRIFEAALTAARCGPAEALHVGDSMKADVEGARGAGIHAVLLDRSLSAGAPPGAGSGTVSSLLDVPALLSSTR